MGVGAGLYMYVVVVQKFTFAISSPDEFLSSYSYSQKEIVMLTDTSFTGQMLFRSLIQQCQITERVILTVEDLDHTSIK